MKLLVTDVTEMHGSNFCIAGWHVAGRRMVRPLPDGSNWTLPLLLDHGVVPGNVIEDCAANLPLRGSYPHLTEDMPVEATKIRGLGVGGQPWFGPDSPPTSDTLSDAFKNHVEHNGIWDGCLKSAYVKVGSNTRSLWAVKVRRNDLSFVEDFGRLKAVLNDGEGRSG